MNFGLKIFLGGGSGSGSCATRCASWIQAASRAAAFWLNPVTIKILTGVLCCICYLSGVKLVIMLFTDR